MAAVSTIALTASALAAGYGAYAANEQAGMQRTARRRQEASQKEALRIQLIERQRAELAAAQAARPSASAALNENPIDAATTDLTGGIERDRLRLMRTSRLGG